MPFWKREAPPPPAPVAAPPPPPPPPRGLRGTLACSQDGCARHDAAGCAYVDRRGHRCPTAWCEDHQVLLQGNPFCRRHARICIAISGGEFQQNQALPDLENRSPSLADYVGDVLEPKVLDLLLRLRRPGSNDQVTAEPLRAYHPNSPATGSRRWDRTWKLFDHTGIITRVSVEVDETRDPEVALRVGSHLVATGVPPWIERRRQGLPSLSAEEDARSRAAFYSSLWDPAVPRVLGEVRDMARQAPGYPVS